jgi:hypothetical protein
MSWFSNDLSSLIQNSHGARCTFFGLVTSFTGFDYILKYFLPDRSLSFLHHIYLVWLMTSILLCSSSHYSMLQVTLIPLLCFCFLFLFIENADQVFCIEVGLAVYPLVVRLRRLLKHLKVKLYHSG